MRWLDRFIWVGIGFNLGVFVARNVVSGIARRTSRRSMEEK